MAMNTITLSGNTRIAGVIGWPISHTLSPAMQNAAFAHYGMPVVYLPFGIPVEGLKPLFATLKGLGALGVNVTVPYKERVLPMMDQLAPSAQDIRAVNTVVFEKGKLIGHNTDGHGFLASLKGVFVLRGKKAVLLGGGGAGRAVAVSLAKAGIAKLAIVEINDRRLKTLIRDVKSLGCRDVAGLKPGTQALQARLCDTDLLVHTTPLGLKPQDPLPIPEAWMPKKKCVMDLVYGKRPTPLMRLAARQQNVIVPGWKMLLLQGAESFRLWTGKKPPVAVMEESLLRAAGIRP